jgi:polar amino acid transport system permease protein
MTTEMRTVAARDLNECQNMPLVPRRHLGRALAAAAIFMLLAWLAVGAVRNPAFGWHTVIHYLFNVEILRGLGLTLWLTALVALLGFALGIPLALMRLSGNPVLRATSAAYVWIFRSVPLLVQLLFWYNIGYLVPIITVKVPFGPTLLAIPSRDLISAAMAAIIGLTCHEAAYAAEIVRGGLISVNRGLIEAAQGLGLSSRTIFRHIILPQALPNILPAVGNLIVGTLKGTSIVSIIAVSDLLYSAQLIYNQNYQIVPLLMVATLWYIAATTCLGLLQGFLERRYASGTERQAVEPKSRVSLGADL